MTLSESLLHRAQALENQALYAEQKKLPAQSRRATAKLMREAAAELNK